MHDVALRRMVILVIAAILSVAGVSLTQLHQRCREGYHAP